MIKKVSKKIEKAVTKKNVKTKKLADLSVKSVTDSFSTPNRKSSRKCPLCKINLQKELLNNTEIDYCSKCLGTWFDEDELALAKDNKDKDLKWLDFDLWEDIGKFRISYGIRLCPTCRMPLYEIYYGDSKIVVDVCSVCHGVWLDRAEFKKIVDYLKQEADYRIIKKYSKNFYKQMGEVFTGPESFKDELLDFIAILKMLSYKFSAQYPTLSKIIFDLPK